MADIALLCAFLNQLATVIREMMQHEVKLVIGPNKKLENLEKNLRALCTVLNDAEKRQWSDEAVKLWMDELKDVSYDMINVLDKWATLFLRPQESQVDQDAYSFAKKIKVRLSVLGSYFHSGPLTVFKIAHKIENLNKRLDEIAARKDRFNFSKTTRNVGESRRPNFSTSIIDVPIVYGRDEHKEKVLNHLLCETSEETESLYIIPIVGMGGIGKTTLAKVVYHDNSVKGAFEERAWVCVSEPFDIFEISKAVVQQLRGDKTSTDVDQCETWMKLFLESIEGKKFLLVLDDVWTDDLLEWGPLENCLRLGAVGSRVVVTTRKKEVAKMIGEKHMLCMEELSKKDCCLLFEEIAFFEKSKEEQEDLKPIAEQIVDKCKGLPLAVKTLGSLLRGKSKEEWQHVLQSDLWELEDAKLEKVKKNLLSPLLLSYYDLPATEKRCFSYCAVFLKDSLIDVKDLIRQWKAQGYLTLKNQMESEGQSCYDMLAMRSFFQDFEYSFDGRIKRCKMHDIVHDFVQFITLGEFSSIARSDAQNVGLFKARHLRLMRSFDGQLPVSILKKKNLHTLIAEDIAVKNVKPQFVYLSCLRTLRLRGCRIEELPESIDKLILLRYLDLSHNHLRSIPITIGNLHNLQTLLLYRCCSAISDSGLPKEIAKLRNLEMFSAECGRPFYGDKFGLKDFSKLNNLRDIVLYIYMGFQEKCVDGPVLQNNINLYSLELDFKNKWIWTLPQISLMEALQPHPNLKCLTIKNYGSRGFPNWMIALTNLKSLCLSNCNTCDTDLPLLGRLQSLETLELRALDHILWVGPRFLGAGIKYNSSGIRDDAESHDGLNFFPKLKRLFFGLPSCVGWTGIPDWSVDSPVRIMPRLEHLEFKRCRNLMALPDFLQRTPLKHLIIKGCDKLEECCRKETGKEWAKIQHVPDIWIIP